MSCKLIYLAWKYGEKIGQKTQCFSLPPAYVVRREGNSFTLLVCSHPGGYLYPIMLCTISQNAMGQTPGGVPCQVQLGGGGYPAGGTLPGGYPSGGVPCLGGYPGRYPPQPGQDGGHPAQGGWYPGRVPPSRVPPSQVRMGGTQLGQHREYLLHGRRYASCIHAGALSC